MRGRAAGALVIVTACGSAARPAPSHAPSAAPALAPLHTGPLVDYVPAAGLRWMAVARLRDLAADPAFSRAVGTLVPGVRLDAFAKSSGVDLRTAPEALAAGFDYSTLYMAATPGENVAVEELFAARALSGAVQRTPDPRVHRIAGVIGQTPEAMVHIDHVLVAVSVGDPTSTRVVEAFARNKLKRSKPAISGAALSALPRELDNEPLRFYAPGPFHREWLDGAHGLLAASLAVAIVGHPTPGGGLAVTVGLAGDWSSAGPDTTSRLLATWEDLAQSPTGHLTGLDHPVAAPIVSVTPKLLKLRVELSSATLAIGLKAIVASDIDEMLGTGGSGTAHENH